jgi:hypothetical protein
MRHRLAEPVGSSGTLPRRDEGIMTPEQKAAVQCRVLALYAKAAALTLRVVGTKEARQHAREAEGAAKIARGWARELERQHREKQKEGK